MSVSVWNDPDHRHQVGYYVDDGPQKRAHRVDHPALFRTISRLITLQEIGPLEGQTQREWIEEEKRLKQKIQRLDEQRTDPREEQAYNWTG